MFAVDIWCIMMSSMQTRAFDVTAQTSRASWARRRSNKLTEWCDCMLGRLSKSKAIECDRFVFGRSLRWLQEHFSHATKQACMQMSTNLLLIWPTFTAHKGIGKTNENKCFFGPLYRFFFPILDQILCQEATGSEGHLINSPRIKRIRTQKPKNACWGTTTLPNISIRVLSLELESHSCSGTLLAGFQGRLDQ